jgi:hypothetical protein
MRLLIAFCVGVAAALAWQSYGDAARQIIAGSNPQLGWLAPRAANAQIVSDMFMPPTTFSDPQDLKAISLGLAAVSQKVDQLATGQEEMTREIAKLQAHVLSRNPETPPRLAPAPVAVPARIPPRPSPAPTPADH